MLKMILSLLVVLVGFLSRATVHALPIEYCSSQNTGSSYAVCMFDLARLCSCLVAADVVAVDAQFQSNGLCHDHCQNDGNGYAFAILQGLNCWCSNYAPGQTTSLSSCNEVCPGFGTETCGSEADGLFGYIALDITPSGTVGLPSTTIPATVSIPPSAGQLSPTPQLSISVQVSTVFVQPTFASSPLKALSSLTPVSL